MIADSDFEQRRRFLKRGRKRIMGPNYFCTPPNKNTAGCDESELGEELKKRETSPLKTMNGIWIYQQWMNPLPKRFCVRGRDTKVSE